MSTGFTIRHTRQGECEPVCTHCRSKSLSKAGRNHDKQRYFCRECKRKSYGLPPDLRPKCPSCKGTVRSTQLRDGRLRFRCPHCQFSFLSEYLIARQEKSKVPLKHRLTFWLDRRARQNLVDYAQTVRCSEAQVVRAIFRNVMTGKVLMVCRGGNGQMARHRPVERNPVAAAMRFPNLNRETARRMHPEGALTGGRFCPTILGVHRMSVALDDAAKEGLVYAMSYLGKNHADAARWLLTYARIPDRTSTPVR